MWEVRVFTGSDARGRPTQLSRTVLGGKRDALKLAAELEVGPGRASPAGRSVSDVLDAWVEQNLDTWAPSSARDQQSRVRAIKRDQISRLPLARLSVGDVERWHTRVRKAGLQDAGIKNLHGVLRAALSQAERWGWMSTKFRARELCLSEIVERLQRDAVPIWCWRADTTTARTTSRSLAPGVPSRRWSGSVVSAQRSRCCGSPMASHGRSEPGRRGVS